jgi:hypothetical protein
MVTRWIYTKNVHDFKLRRSNRKTNFLCLRKEYRSTNKQSRLGLLTQMGVNAGGSGGGG